MSLFIPPQQRCRECQPKHYSLSFQRNEEPKNFALWLWTARNASAKVMDLILNCRARDYYYYRMACKHFRWQNNRCMIFDSTPRHTATHSTAWRHWALHCNEFPIHIFEETEEIQLIAFSCNVPFVVQIEIITWPQRNDGMRKSRNAICSKNDDGRRETWRFVRVKIIAIKLLADRWWNEPEPERRKKSFVEAMCVAGTTLEHESEIDEKSSRPTTRYNIAITLASNSDNKTHEASCVFVHFHEVSTTRALLRTHTRTEDWFLAVYEHLTCVSGGHRTMCDDKLHLLTRHRYRTFQIRGFAVRPPNLINAVMSRFPIRNSTKIFGCGFSIRKIGYNEWMDPIECLCLSAVEKGEFECITHHCMRQLGTTQTQCQWHSSHVHRQLTEQFSSIETPENINETMQWSEERYSENQKSNNNGLFVDNP